MMNTFSYTVDMNFTNVNNANQLKRAKKPDHVSG
jgi:hypothetical protein